MNDTFCFFGVNGWQLVERVENGACKPLNCLKQESVGKHIFSSFVQETYLEHGDENTKHKILSLLFESNLRGEQVVLFKDKVEENDATEFRKCAKPSQTVFTVADFLRRFPRNMSEKQHRILMNAYRQHPTPGEPLEKFQGPCWFYYASNLPEEGFLLECMRRKGWLDIKLSHSLNGYSGIEVIPKIGIQGWYEIEKTLEPLISNQGFIAMSFDPKLNAASAAIKQAIEETGFQPQRIDSKEHNNEISGEILYEISRSRFVVADVTGQRAGVYFEAGYAMGLGIPVIWTCKEDDLENVHFDTRQYSHVVWKDDSELATNLANRIKGTILLKHQ